MSIAEELQARGHEIFFALSKNKHDLIKQSKIKPIPIAESVLDDDLNSIEKLKNPDFVLQLVQEEQRLIDQYKPDCAVVDFRVSAFVSCHSRSLPMFMITGSGGLPYGCYIPNPGFPDPIYKLVSPLIQKMIWNAKKKFLDSLSTTAFSIGSPFEYAKLFQKITYIVPEVAGYLPPVNTSLAINYVGPILWSGFEQKSPSWLNGIRPNGKTIYVSFGGTGYDGRKLIDLSSALVNKGYRVLVSSSNIADVGNFSQKKNLYVEKYLPGIEVCKRVDLVICHGGYGTMIQAVLAGKPIVTIPFNPDQLLHALRFQELGMAKCIIAIDLFAIMGFKWQDLMDIGKKINVDTILTAVENTMQSHIELENKTMLFRDQIHKTTGAKEAANVIESNF